jgi:extracellular factor (EF) 3-hydroxypalmitic acid methyl ester biosynthesis protein
MSHPQPAAIALSSSFASSSSSVPASAPPTGSAAAQATDLLRRACARFFSIPERGPSERLTLLYETAVAMHAFARAVTECEDAGLTRLELLPLLEGVRALHARSPFVHRLQTWPRGYPGDFETVEWLCDAGNRAEADTVPWALEQCALQSPLAQQHRNKVGLQARAILATLAAKPTARIASIGCGGCRELSLIQDYVAKGRGSFTLIDADAGALDFARRRLGALKGRCEFVQGRVPRVLAKLRATGGFDLVVAGGLFDYLQDRWAVATLNGARELLAPGGRVFLSNIAAGNPFRPWIEYLADWWLIERDESDLLRLLEQAGFDVARASVTRDSSGLALIAEAPTPDAAR